MKINRSINIKGKSISFLWASFSNGKFGGKLMCCRCKVVVKLDPTNMHALVETHKLLDVPRKTRKRVFFAQLATNPTPSPVTPLSQDSGAWVVSPAPPQGNPKCLSAFPHSMHLFIHLVIDFQPHIAEESLVAPGVWVASRTSSPLFSIPRRGCLCDCTNLQKDIAFISFL